MIDLGIQPGNLFFGTAPSLLGLRTHRNNFLLCFDQDLFALHSQLFAVLFQFSRERFARLSFR